jgi:hypothetical protein
VAPNDNGGFWDLNVRNRRNLNLDKNGQNSEYLKGSEKEEEI